METKKIIGYVLIAVGILAIILPLWQVYGIMTGQSSPAKVFMNPLTLAPDKNVSATDIEGQVRNALVKVLPLDLINSILNLSAWSLLMIVLIFGGGKLADIGIKLIKS